MGTPPAALIKHVAARAVGSAHQPLASDLLEAAMRAIDFAARMAQRFYRGNVR